MQEVLKLGSYKDNFKVSIKKSLNKEKEREGENEEGEMARGDRREGERKRENKKINLHRVYYVRQNAW